LAFNLDKAESLMDQYRGEELKMILGAETTLQFFRLDRQTLCNEIKERYLGRPLWKYALTLAIFFLLVEILLIRFLK
jgi:hypothetical protein